MTAALHDRVAQCLADADQRYTENRRLLVNAFLAKDRPMTVPELVAVIDGLPLSSAYRNLSVLQDAGVVTRIATSDDNGRYELTEGFSGHHHHHLVCEGCGIVVDIAASPTIERALRAAARRATQDHGFAITDHRIDLIGRCATCQR